MDLGLLQHDIFTSIGHKPLQFMAVFFDPAAEKKEKEEQKRKIKEKDSSGENICSVVWRGVVWCGVVRCGVMWCGVV